MEGRFSTLLSLGFETARRIGVMSAIAARAGVEVFHKDWGGGAPWLDGRRCRR